MISSLDSFLFWIGLFITAGFTIRAILTHKKELPKPEDPLKKSRRVAVEEKFHFLRELGEVERERFLGSSSVETETLNSAIAEICRRVMKKYPDMDEKVVGYWVGVHMRDDCWGKIVRPPLNEVLARYKGQIHGPFATQTKKFMREETLDKISQQFPEIPEPVLTAIGDFIANVLEEFHWRQFINVSVYGGTFYMKDKNGNWSEDPLLGGRAVVEEMIRERRNK